MLNVTLFISKTIKKFSNGTTVLYVNYDKLASKLHPHVLLIVAAVYIRVACLIKCESHLDKEGLF